MRKALKDGGEAAIKTIKTGKAQAEQKIRFASKFLAPRRA
jgi:hypothetical protein